MPSELMSHNETVDFTGFKIRPMNDEEIDEMVKYIMQSEEVDEEQMKKEARDGGIIYDFEGLDVKIYSIVMIEYQVRSGRRKNDRCMFSRSSFIKRGEAELDSFFEDIDEYFYI